MKFYILVLLSLGSLTACESLIEIDTPSSLNNIVVEADLTSQTEVWQVRITNSQAYNNQDSTLGVDNAFVTIADNLGNIDTLYHEAKGLYKTSIAKACLPGLTYFLKIEANGKVFEASDYCRYQNPIDTFTAYFLPDDNGFIEKGWYAFQQSLESEIEGDYYEWNIYKNDTLQDQFGLILDEDANRDVSFFNMDVDPNDPLAGIDQGILPRPYPFRFNPGDTIIMEQYCINKGYYNFLFEVQNQLNRSGTPFDPPPANPNSNISNGAYGYFAVKNKVTASTTIPE
jgi:hypothetical protein